MPRRRKIPEQVKITIPSDRLELYRANILEILLPPEQAKAAEKVIRHIYEYGRIYPDEIGELAESPAEHKNMDRAINKLLALGILARGKEGSYILDKASGVEANEFLRKLAIISDKVEGLLLGKL